MQLAGLRLINAALIGKVDAGTMLDDESPLHQNCAKEGSLNHAYHLPLVRLCRVRLCRAAVPR